MLEKHDPSLLPLPAGWLTPLAFATKVCVVKVLTFSPQEAVSLFCIPRACVRGLEPKGPALR